MLAKIQFMSSIYTTFILNKAGRPHLTWHMYLRKFTVAQPNFIFKYCEDATKQKY